MKVPGLVIDNISPEAGLRDQIQGKNKPDDEEILFYQGGRKRGGES